MNLNNNLKSHLSKHDGFSLIELAIVLVILGLLLGMGTGLIGMLTKRAKLHETRGIIDAGIESLISYGASNNSLPDTVTFSTVVRNPNDVWGKSLYYITDDDLTDSTYGGICGRKTTQLQLLNCPSTGCGTPTNTISNVALIIISGSANFNNQTSIPVTNPVTTSTDINHYNQGLQVDDYTTDMNRTEPYDDVVKWITLDELRIKAGCDVPHLNIVNNELPYGFESSTYTATIFGDGGVPYASGGIYKWCREQSAITGLTFTPDILSTDCSGLTESSWLQADEIAISGTPTANGSFNFTFFVRDNNDDGGNNDNVSQKTLVMTINPASGGGGGGGCSTSCSEFRVWNTNDDDRDFSIGGTCREDVNDGSEATQSGFRLDSGETINRHSDKDNNCTDSIAESLTYDAAACADSDTDCRVYIDGTDR
jgi:prepilin-type N-terminal cleavage/methylation domain-containing protein